MKVKEIHSSTKQIQSSAPAIGARICYRLAHQGIRLIVIKIKQAQQGWKLKRFSVACKERNIVGTESCCNTADEDSTPAGIVFPNSLWRVLSVVTRAWWASERSDAGTKLCCALKSSHFLCDVEAHLMESPFSFRKRFWVLGGWCEKNPIICGIWVYFCLIFYFLLFWSESPRENFVGNFSGSLPVIREHIFLLKKTRKGLIGFLALPWIGTFCHSLITLRKKPEIRRLSYFQGNSKSLSPPVF